MYNKLVVAMELDHGIYQEWRGLHNPVRGQTTEKFDSEGMETEECLRRCPIWACTDSDMDEVVKKISTIYVGREIKVFNLVSASTRIPGELIHKQIDKDGVLPA